MASPAQPADASTLTMEVLESREVHVSGTIEGTPSRALLAVRGRIVDRVSSTYPTDLRLTGEETLVRLYPSYAAAIEPGAILTVLTRGHSVYDEQAGHLVVDIVSPADLENTSLMAVARRNPAVPVLHLKRIEELLRSHGSPYMEEGFVTLLEWELAMEVRPLPSPNELDLTIYDVDFYPTTGRVNAEWTLRVDLDQSTVEEVVLWEEAPEPDFDEPLEE